MDCRQFRKQHAFFVDDMLSGVETWAMRDHVSGCSSCAKFDSQLRRSLFLARQARTIEPSEDFQRKLSARLAAERLSRPLHERDPQTSTRFPMLAAAAAVVAAVGLSAGMMHTSTADEPVSLAPVTAVPPAPLPLKRTDAAVGESTSVEPVHPAVLLAQRAAEQFIAAQSRAAAVRVTH
jgi:hypothetical protein